MPILKPNREPESTESPHSVLRERRPSRAQTDADQRTWSAACGLQARRPRPHRRTPARNTWSGVCNPPASEQPQTSTCVYGQPPATARQSRTRQYPRQTRQSRRAHGHSRQQDHGPRKPNRSLTRPHQHLHKRSRRSDARSVEQPADDGTRTCRPARATRTSCRSAWHRRLRARLTAAWAPRGPRRSPRPQPVQEWCHTQTAGWYQTAPRPAGQSPRW